MLRSGVRSPGSRWDPSYAHTPTRSASAHPKTGRKHRDSSSESPRSSPRRSQLSRRCLSKLVCFSTVSFSLEKAQKHHFFLPEGHSSWRRRHLPGASPAGSVPSPMGICDEVPGNKKRMKRLSKPCVTVAL